MQRLRVGFDRNGKQNLRNFIASIVLLSALGVGGCGMTAKPLGSQNAEARGTSTINLNTITTNSSTTNRSLSSLFASSSPIASQLAASPTSVNFGSVNVGNATTQLISLTNTGAASVGIASVSVSAGFNTTAGLNITLTPNQSVNIYVSFQPSAAGSATGMLTIASTAADSILQVGLSGAGTAVPSAQHSVALDWSASTSAVAGYNVYRGSTTGGPYAKLNPEVDPVADFNDAGVAGGTTYYYVVTSVDNSNVESAYSNQVAVSVP